MGRMRLRRPRGAGESFSAALVGLAVLVLLARTAAAVVDAVIAVWPVLPACALVAGTVAVRRIRRASSQRARDRARLAALRLTLTQLDALDDRRFECALRDLLIRDGWTARRVGGGGDQAADVIAYQGPFGRIVVQAKHTRVGGKVGSSVMYAVKGTAGPVHGADHAVVVTNGGFTRDARQWGDRHGVHWVDRERLRRWAETGAALHDLLGLVARPRTGRFRRAA